jgi:hypothetical protein
MQKAEIIDYKGYTINIYYDHQGPDPIQEYDHLGTIYCCHRRYRLGDEQPDPEWLKGYVQEVAEDGGVVLPLYLYDHSGISISTRSFHGRAHHAEWDSGLIGFAVVTRQDIYDNWSIKRATKRYKDWSERIMKAVIKEYDLFLQGQVFGFEVISPDGEELDSCWGFYGDNWENNGLYEHAKPAIDYHIAKQLRDHFEQVKTWIRNQVPYHIRQQKLKAS